MLSISSTIHEIEKALKERSLSQVAKEMSVGKAKLARILTSVGYEYDSSKRKWRYVWLDERADHRHRSFWHVDEYGLTGNPKSEGASEMANKSNTDITEPNEQESNAGVNSFTPEEVAALKELAQFHIERANEPLTGAEDVHKAIQELETAKTTRKTFVVDETLVAQLDAFCDSRKIKKSDALAVAIADLLAKYQ